MSLFDRNLNKCGQTIDIQSRATVAATFGNPDPEQDFTTLHSVKAIIKTPVGKATFDEVGIDGTQNFGATHQFCIKWITGLSQENWILFGSKRYDILNDINCCERNEVLIFFCKLRGSGEASKG